MISIYQLIWLVPVVFMFGVFYGAVLRAAGKDD